MPTSNERKMLSSNEALKELRVRMLLGSTVKMPEGSDNVKFQSEVFTWMDPRHCLSTTQQYTDVHCGLPALI